MEYLAGTPDNCMKVIDEYLSQRLKVLKGRDRNALLMEYKEWLIEDQYQVEDIWTIPDLTDEGLCDFFKRAISRK